MLASIPADLMMRFSPDARVSLKPVLYGLSVGLGLFAVMAVSKDSAFAIAGGTEPPCGVCHVPGHTAAHLTAFALLRPCDPFSDGVNPVGRRWSEPPLERLRRMVLVSWLSISAYLVFFSFVGRFSASSLDIARDSVRRLDAVPPEGSRCLNDTRAGVPASRG